eukprot:2383708-Rhodomonas_salina.3
MGAHLRGRSALLGALHHARAIRSVTGTALSYCMCVAWYCALATTCAEAGTVWSYWVCVGSEQSYWVCAGLVLVLKEKHLRKATEEESAGGHDALQQRPRVAGTIMPYFSTGHGVAGASHDTIVWYQAYRVT